MARDRRRPSRRPGSARARASRAMASAYSARPWRDASCAWRAAGSVPVRRASSGGAAAAFLGHAEPRVVVVAGSAPHRTGPGCSRCVRAPGHVEHRFRCKPNTHSGASRTLIPTQAESGLTSWLTKVRCNSPSAGETMAASRGWLPMSPQVDREEARRTGACDRARGRDRRRYRHESPPFGRFGPGSASLTRRRGGSTFRGASSASARSLEGLRNCVQLPLNPGRSR